MCPVSSTQHSSSVDRRRQILVSPASAFGYAAARRPHALPCDAPHTPGETTGPADATLDDDSVGHPAYWADRFAVGERHGRDRLLHAAAWAVALAGGGRLSAWVSDAQMRGHPDGLNFIVKVFSVLYARQRVGHDQPAVDGNGEPIMVVNGRRRAGG